MNVAALFVRADGPYPTLAADWWDERRDATRYAGPLPVVAHPPCKRWGRFWSADGSTQPGMDGGLFAFALAAVRRWGGVLEHPEGSHAWRVFGIPTPRLGDGWISTPCGGHTCCVAQRNYGHRARKLTWLYAFGTSRRPDLDWTDPGSGGVYLSQPGRCSRAKPRPTCPCDRCREMYGDAWRGADKVGAVRMTARENELTPEPFARLLIEIAASCRGSLAPPE